MRPILRAITAMTFLSAIFPAPVRAQDATIFVVTYVEVVSNAADSAETLLKSYRDASRGASGCANNQAYEVLQQSNRPNHFSIVEIWKNIAALDAHVDAQQTRDFHQALQ
jgi:quinol monooxygenase YgiN